jgi:hypothetical protein
MLAEESARQDRPIKMIGTCYGNEKTNLQFGLDVRQWVEEKLVDILHLYPFASFSGPFDRDFYLRLRKEKGVKLIVGNFNSKEYARWKTEYLAEFDGIVMEGITSEKGFEALHPLIREDMLQFGPPTDKTNDQPKAPETAPIPVDQIQGLPIGKPFYCSGL